MAQVVFEINSWILGVGVEEASLRAALAAVIDADVVSAEAVREVRKAEAAALRERMAELSEDERDAAIREFAERHGYLGRGNVSSLRRFARKLAADERADVLLESLSLLSPEERVAAVDRFRGDAPQASFKRLLEHVEEVDPVTAQAARMRIPREVREGLARSPDVVVGLMAEPAVLSIVVPAVAGAVTSKIVDAALDWVLAVSRRRGPDESPVIQEVIVYGPDGEVLSRVEVTPQSRRS